ncbi:MAG: ROK family protein [Acetobacteraceae bacterium]|nr:ROK family protein [Acetobacteraceae bacterium]
MDVVVAGNTEQQASGGVRTLAIDIGGTRLKGSVLDEAGQMSGEPARVDTPLRDPDAVVEALVKLVEPLGAFDRVSVGFPGVVIRGCIRTAPNLGTPEWKGYPLAARLAERFGRPVRVLNDGSVQGLGVISGEGLECVITLGTGVGFALFHSGKLAPHLELGQHPVKDDKTYDQYLGNAALRDIGKKKWNKRVERVIALLQTLSTYDTLYIGGGNAKAITCELPGNVRITANAAGITGGIHLWDDRVDETYF